MPDFPQNMDSKPQEHAYFFQKNQWKKCFMKDCIEFQKVMEQRLAQMLFIVPKGKSVVYSPVKQSTHKDMNGKHITNAKIPKTSSH